MSESGSDGEDWCISFDFDGRLCTPAAAELDYSFDVVPAFVDPKEVDVEALKLDCQWAGFPLASKAPSTKRPSNARPASGLERASLLITICQRHTAAQAPRAS